MVLGSFTNDWYNNVKEKICEKLENSNIDLTLYNKISKIIEKTIHNFIKKCFWMLGTIIVVVVPKRGLTIHLKCKMRTCHTQGGGDR